ncbi:16050_t:CDS:10, partial [Acaulospora morrowiae]
SKWVRPPDGGFSEDDRIHPRSRLSSASPGRYKGTNYEQTEGLVVLEYFSLENEKKWLKNGFVGIPVRSDLEFAVQAPYLLYCDSKATNFRLCRFGEFEESWDIKLTENEINEVSKASFYGAVIMDGPVIVLVYKDYVRFSEEEFEPFEENNVHIFLQRPSSQTEAKYSLNLPAHCIYGFWQGQLDEDLFQNVENLYGIVKVIYRPLYEANIRIASFHENFSPLERSFVSKIPGFYARMTTCIMKSRGQDLVWIGTEQNQVLCFKDDDAKPKWGTFISGTSLLMTEVLLDKRNAGFESTLIVQTTDGRRVIMDSESGKVLHEIQAGFDIVTGEFLLQGFDDIVRLPNSSRCDPSHWELIDVGEFRVNAMSTAETYDEIQITDSTHMSSLLDSLSTRVNDGIAQIREIEETLNQKYDLLFHCDSLLESFSNIFVSNHLQQSFLTKRNLRTNRSIENLIPLLSDTPVISNEDVDDRPPKDRNELQILDAKMIYGGINNYDKVFLDISVINNSCKDLHSIHLVAYPKNSSVSSSMIRVHSPYINVLAAGQKDNISILIDLPLDHLLYGLELGVILWYQIIDNSTLDKKYDEIGWHSIYIEKIRSPNTMKNDLDKFLPSATYFMFNNSISLHKQWDLTMLPFILEQYLGVESSFLNNASHEFRTTDGSCWLRLFRPYKCPSPDTCENEISINITRQLMEIRSHDDKNLTFMTKILCRELSGDILIIRLVVSVPSPLFYSELSVYDGLDDFFFAVEDLLKTDCLASQHDVVMDRSIKRLLCAKLANWLFAL